MGARYRLAVCPPEKSCVLWPMDPSLRKKKRFEKAVASQCAHCAGKNRENKSNACHAKSRGVLWAGARAGRSHKMDGASIYCWMNKRDRVISPKFFESCSSKKSCSLGIARLLVIALSVRSSKPPCHGWWTYYEICVVHNYSACVVI